MRFRTNESARNSVAELEHDARSRDDRSCHNADDEKYRHDNEVLLRTTVRAEEDEQADARRNEQAREHGSRAEHAFHIQVGDDDTRRAVGDKANDGRHNDRKRAVRAEDLRQRMEKQEAKEETK